MSKIVLKYFNLGNLCSRGGPVRFLFFAHNIDFTDSWLDFASWPAEKARLIASGENPVGFIPVVYDGDKILVEHHAIVRYYAKQAGVYGKDAWKDFVEDAVADSTKDWRAEWVGAVLGSDEKKAAYAASLKPRYVTLEALLKKYGGLGETFSIGEATVFAQVYDDRNLGNKIDLAEFPHINAVVQKALQYEKIRAWCDSHGKPF